MATSKTDICNMALQELQYKGTITNLDEETTPEALLFKSNYDRVRQLCLREVTPSFARTRRNLPLLDKTPEFGYSFAYEKPAACLRVLGIGEVHAKENNYSIENVDGSVCIVTDYAKDNSLPLRYVKDVEDINLYTTDFLNFFAKRLALACRSLSQNPVRLAALASEADSAAFALKGMDGQENPPMRRSVSRIQPRDPAYNHIDKR